jgi:methylamine dehydrogenase accessory protein MauD
MDGVLLAVRLLLAATFLVAALAKVLDRAGTRRSAEQLGAPAALAPVVATALPAIEVVVAVALIPTATAWAASLAAVAMLLAFTGAVANAVARGTEAECHCFGRVSAEPVGWGTLARNVTLLASAGFVVVAGFDDAGASATAWIGDLSALDGVLVAGVAVLAAGVAVNATFLFQLFRQNGRLLAEMAELREKTGLRPDPPEVGEPVPSFTLPGLRDQMVTLDDLLADGRGLLLLFTSPDCSACEPLLPRIGSLDEAQGDLQPVMLSLGSPDEVRVKAAEHGIDPVLMIPDFELPRSLGITGSPGAIVVDADGRVASAPALGSGKVGELLSAWTGPPELVHVEGGG